MAIREIRKEGDAVLRKHCRKVEALDEKLFQLLDDMAETMHQANGVGLAAPQVGILKQVAVVDIGEGVIELINPEIISQRGAAVDVEGCLSVPGVWAHVERPQTVKVRALGRDGQEHIYKGSGLLARAFCHEIEHLSGQLFIDKAIRFVSPEEEEK